MAKLQRTGPRADSSASSKKVRLRPANPFDLIRVIARSQSDPRKAVCELVQNSLDADAHRVTLTRRRSRGDVAIAILDDGRGVFPEVERPEALERIAKNVGRSFKLNLTPEERQRQMMLGQYGIGILGFWAVGEELEMRSRVEGSDVWALRLLRDNPTAELYRVPARRIAFPEETWTEVIIRRVDPAAARQLVARRLGDYLGAELRGQLLERSVKLRLVDRLARGKAPKDFVVVPRRFQGRRIHELESAPVPDHSPVRLELYFVGEEEDRRSAVVLTCGGSVVCDDISTIESHGMDRPPWSSGCLEGVVEFPDLEVAPATRRGFTPGRAADALFAALRSAEPLLLEIVEAEREKRRVEEDTSVARELRKVFRPLARTLPHYDFFEIRKESTGMEDPGTEDEGAKLGQTEVGAEGPLDEHASSEIIEDGDSPEPPPEILPPGPLASVRIVPRRSRLLPGATRTLHARAADGTGRTIPEGVEFQWALSAGAGSLAPAGADATFTAPEILESARVSVTASQGECNVTAESTIEVVDRLGGERPDAGIPDPKRVYDPAGNWRSRICGRRWEYNAAHPDYRSTEDTPKRRFRYLVHLFAKEIVLRNYGEAKDDRVLEKMVEVLTHIQPRA